MNPNNGDSAETSDTPLDVIDRVVRPTQRDSLLNETNLGLGNYEKGMYWQQVEDFKNHLYGEAAFGGGKNMARAVDDVKYRLAADRWAEMSEAEREAAREDMTDEGEPPASKRQWFDETGEDLFEDKVEPDADEFGGALTPEERNLLRLQATLELVDERVNVDGELQTAMARMLVMKHEGSRGIDAHLMDSVTGRAKEYSYDGEPPPKRSRRGRR